MRSFLLYLAGFLVLLMLQEFLLDSISLLSLLNIYIYIMIIVMLPMQLSPVNVLLSAAMVGAVMDIFSGTSSLITICLLAVAFARTWIMNLTLSREVVVAGGVPFSRRVGRGHFLRYTFAMCLLFAIPYFLLEMMTMEQLGVTIARIATSSVATMLLIYVLQLPLRGKNG